MKNIPVDDIFSYWILAWFFAFMAYPNEIPNPAFALMLGVVENIGMSAYLIAVQAPMYIVYILTMATTKFVPLYFAWKHSPIDWRTSAITFLYLFLLYTLYLAIKGTSPVEVYTNIFQSVKQGGVHTPFYQMMAYLHLMPKR